MSDETMVETNLIETTPTSETPIEKAPVSDGKHYIGTAAGKPTTPKNLSPKAETPGTKQSTAVAAEKVIAPEYTPNFKFKVFDQEKEVDEWLRPIVKNKEMEDKVRDLLTKAHGLPKIKSERDGLRTEYDNFKKSIANEYAPIVQNYRDLSKMSAEARQSGDWGQFFHAAQIPAQAVIRWAANTVAHLEKNPNYLDQAQNSWKTNSNLTNLQSENETLKQQTERLHMERQQMELDYHLRTPEIQDYAQSFDTRMATPNAFRNEVIRRGALIEMTENRVATPQEIVSDMMRIYGGVPQAPSQTRPMQGQVQSEGTTTAVTGSEGKPVLPNIKGRSGSPAKTIVKSTDDLRKIYAQRNVG